MFVRQWDYTPPDTALAAELAEACEIHPFLSLLLTARGMTEPEEIGAYLNGSEEGIDPLMFADMEKAVERVERALSSGEKILIYGDYDVDGVTATVLLYDYLKKRGADVLYRLPLREGGYGLHEQDVVWAKEQGVSLIVTVDNGISLCKEADLATENGIDMVITDHHQPSSDLPRAVAVVDPYRPDCESTCKYFAGVGMAFMLVCALDGDGERVLAEYGDLLTLGTLADVISLEGLNRDLMRRGMSLLNNSRRPGLVALRQRAGCADKELSSRSVTFTLTPRLNAAGRMADPDLAARLLLAQDAEQAEQLADQLAKLNEERQRLGNELTESVLNILHGDPSLAFQRVLVVEGRGWRSGVLGILSARLTEKFGRPSIVLSTDENGISHGSGRSLAGFSLHDALSACADCLITYGGHDQAGGMTLAASNIPAFRQQINDYAAQNGLRMPVPSLSLAVRLRPDQIDTEKLALLAALEPCGAGNPAPLFGLCRMTIESVIPLGGGKHVKLNLMRDGCRISTVKFQTSPEELIFKPGDTVNCVAELEKNEYNGRVSVSIRIRDLGYADTDREKLQEEIACFERLVRREERLPEALPDRDLLAGLYRWLYGCRSWKGTPEQLVHEISARMPDAGSVRLLPILTALEVWRQAGLADYTDEGETLSVRILPADGKVDLTQTPLWQYAEGGI